MLPPSPPSCSSRSIRPEMQTRIQTSKASPVISSHLLLTLFDLHFLHPAPSQSDNHPSDHQPTTICDLPDDILILLFSRCDIETIFSLRLTCNSLRSVIEEYITTIAPASARYTYPSCDLLLKPPRDGHSIRWLRDLIPAQLASIVLDKDKLRRHPYDCGFLYGIPSESDCEEALHWRKRITNGWKVLRQFHLISSAVYSSFDGESQRPNGFRKVSGGVRSTRIWQAASCPYAGCTEHGMRRVFTSKHRRDSHDSHNEQQKEATDLISGIRRKEAQILKKRLAHLDTLSTQDLLDYTNLWRILLHIFRPYTKPEPAVHETAQPSPLHTVTPRPSWPSVISDISQGCSWLNWFILHTGTAPFLAQWTLSPPPSSSPQHTSHHIRNTIHHAWTTRSTHQIELERDYISRFELALRKRCLSAERLRILDAEIMRGRSINTISLDCIPWVYDQHHCISRPREDFPWYEPGKRVWLDGEWGIRCAPGSGWGSPGVLRGTLCKFEGRDDDADMRDERGPLGEVPYLVYLGTQSASVVWPGSKGDGVELAF